MFSQTDFNANPGKYQLFTTARIARKVKGFNVGEIVGIKYFCTNVNAASIGKPLQPVYEIVGRDTYLYARALDNFVL